MRNRALTDGQRETLEALVDGTTLRGVLIALREIASAKAEHIATNGQDATTADVWEKAAIQIGNTADRVRV